MMVRINDFFCILPFLGTNMNILSRMVHIRKSEIIIKSLFQSIQSKERGCSKKLRFGRSRLWRSRA